MQTEVRSLSCQKISRIVKVHEKTRIKSLSTAILLLLTKHKENRLFHYSSDSLADLREKTRAKCDLTRIHITSIENTRENTCKNTIRHKTHPKTRQIFTSKSKLLEKTRANCNPMLSKFTKLQNPRDIPQQITSESQNHCKNTRKTLTGDRQTDGRTGAFLEMRNP